MDIFFILILELVAIGITGSTVVLVGLSEAAEPQQSRREDLSSWEIKRVTAERFRRLRSLVIARAHVRPWRALAAGVLATRAARSAQGRS